MEISVSTPLRYVQPPFAIHKRPEVCEGVFARLDDYVKLEVERLRAQPKNEPRDLILGFFEWALASLDADAYAEIQDRYISAARNGRGHAVKFLNLPYYARHKINQLHRINIQGMPPSRILDVGCGPGHAHLVGRHFGHEVFGIDIPLSADHIYNALCDFFAAAKTEHRVEPRQRLPRFPGGRFDLVTVLILNIGPWGEAEWQFFIEDLQANQLKEGGAIYLSFTTTRWTPEAWNYISRIAEWTRADRIAFIR